MNITEIQEYIRREKPTAAYLGRLEMQAMVAEAESHGWVRPDCYIGNQDLARLEFCGCPIFEVISESHAGFSSHNAEVRHGAKDADLD
jgi:hypothetical protein